MQSHDLPVCDMVGEVLDSCALQDLGRLETEAAEGLCKLLQHLWC